MSQLLRALAISRKDVESYYGKPPLITWGLLFPAVLILAVYLKDQPGYLSIAPGLLAMTLLFGNTSMAAIVITFEKRTGTLERLLLAPVKTSTIVLGKAASAAAYGMLTTLVLAAGLWLLLGMRIERPLLFSTALVLGAGVFSLAGLAASILVKEVFEAMTLMNFFRFPLLFISGVFLPLAEMPPWLMPVALVSPLTHVVELMRAGVSGQCYWHACWIPATVLAGLLLAGAPAAVWLFQARLTR